MNTFSFRVILLDHSSATEDMANALYEAGLDDASVSSSNGSVSVSIDRDAESLDGAIVSACQQIRAAGYEVASIEIEKASIDALMETA